MRVAIAHEWLVRHAGSERCVEEMLQAFPGAHILTTVVKWETVPNAFIGAKPSFLQRIPGAPDRHEWLLPLMPMAWRLRAPIGDVDVVVSSSHSCAKAVRIENGIPHLCYCHTPMRYAWNFEAEAERFPRPLRPLSRVGMAWFRRWDRTTAQRVDRFVANSSAVADRIRRFYGREAQVLHPPVRTEFFTPAGERSDFFLYVGRLVAYKRADLAIEGFRGLPFRLLVVGRGQREDELHASAPPNVTFLGEVDDLELRHLYRRARALVAPAEEDFGIAMAEAQACGAPVVALDGGGARDIVEDGRTGWLFPRQEVGELRRAVRLAAKESLDENYIRARSERFAVAKFRAALRTAVDELVKEAGR